MPCQKLIFAIWKIWNLSYCTKYTFSTVHCSTLNVYILCMYILRYYVHGLKKKLMWKNIKNNKCFTELYRKFWNWIKRDDIKIQWWRLWKKSVYLIFLNDKCIKKYSFLPKVFEWEMLFFACIRCHDNNYMGWIVHCIMHHVFKHSCIIFSASYTCCLVLVNA